MSSAAALVSEIDAELNSRPDIVSAASVGGFVNFSLPNNVFASRLRVMLDQPQLSVRRMGGRVLIDYGRPNIAKAMHVGHLRSGVIGESVKRLFRYAGAEVIGDIHFGDWGLQIGQLIALAQTERPELAFFDESHEGEYPDDVVTAADLERMYPLAASLSRSNPVFLAASRLAVRELQAGRRGYHALWQQFSDVSKVAIREQYDRLGVSFDVWMRNTQPSCIRRIAPLKGAQAARARASW